MTRPFMPKNRLISHDITVSTDAVSDFLYVLMLNIEDALQLAGAKPEKDYTYKDLMNFASQIYNIDHQSEALTMPRGPSKEDL